MFCCSPENHVKVTQKSFHCIVQELLNSLCHRLAASHAVLMVTVKDVSETLKVEITCLEFYFYPSSMERDKCTLHRADICSQDSWLSS